MFLTSRATNFLDYFGFGTGQAVNSTFGTFVNQVSVNGILRQLSLEHQNHLDQKIVSDKILCLQFSVRMLLRNITCYGTYDKKKSVCPSRKIVQWPWPGLELRALDPESTAVTIRPPQLPLFHTWLTPAPHLCYLWTWGCRVDWGHSSATTLWSQLVCPLNMEACTPEIKRRQYTVTTENCWILSK